MKRTQRNNRIEKLRQRLGSLRVRLLPWVGAAGVIGALAAVLFWAFEQISDPQVFPIQVVRIEGDFRHLSKDSLERAVAEAVRGGFFTVDVSEVRGAARRMPWVDQVSVRRIWPDRILMTVTEQIPVAIWGEDRLVNQRGVLFRPDPRTFPPGLPRFKGPDHLSEWVGSRYRKMQEQLAVHDLRIREIELNHRRSWMLVLHTGLELKLGSEDWEGRLARFVRLYPSLESAGKGEIDQIDLRYTNGFAVRWKEHVQPEQAESRVGLRLPHNVFENG